MGQIVQLHLGTFKRLEWDGVDFLNVSHETFGRQHPFCIAWNNRIPVENDGSIKGFDKTELTLIGVCNDNGWALYEKGDPAYAVPTIFRPWDLAPILGPVLIVQEVINEHGEQDFGPLDPVVIDGLCLGLVLMGWKRGE